MPLTGRRPYTRELRVAQFWAKVEMTATCWVWTGVKSSSGYGRYWWGGVMEGAHRVSLEIAGKKIRSGVDVHHICRNTSCVRPSHLKPLTRKEHARHGVPATRATCRKGHIYTKKTLLLSAKGHRSCRLCRASSEAARYRANPERWREWQRRYRKTERYRRWFKAWYASRKAGK